MSTAAQATPAKVSFLKHVGQMIGKILRIISKDVAPAADQAAKVAEVLMPQFSPEIMFADNLITKIAKQCVVTESIAAATGIAVTGPEKLSTAVDGIGREIDAWVSAAFPGAKQVSAAKKAGLVSAVADIVNELEAAPVAAS